MVKKKEQKMAYVVYKHNQEYGPREGLEGPFHYPSGQVAYYDPKAGRYWDPRTDFYLEDDEAIALQNTIFGTKKETV
jgi:hypothetical protein